MHAGSLGTRERRNRHHKLRNPGEQTAVNSLFSSLGDETRREDKIKNPSAVRRRSKRNGTKRSAARYKSTLFSLPYAPFFSYITALPLVVASPFFFSSFFFFSFLPPTVENVSLAAYDVGHRTIVVGSRLWINCKRYPQQSARTFTWQLRLPVVLLLYGSIVMPLDRVIVNCFENYRGWRIYNIVKSLGMIFIGEYEWTIIHRYIFYFFVNQNWNVLMILRWHAILWYLCSGFMERRIADWSCYSVIPFVCSNLEKYARVLNQRLI